MSLFREIQFASGIVVSNEGFHAFCECYRLIDKEQSEALFLEDLTQQQFKMLDHRTEDISFQHASLVMSALGRLHGLSFVLKNQSPNILQKLVSQMPEVFFCGSDQFLREFFEELKPRVLNSLHQDSDTKIVSKLKLLFCEPHFDVAMRCVDGPSAEPYAVICHGDCWNNNILYKFDAVRFGM